jgi:hypothetical protein
MALPHRSTDPSPWRGITIEEVAEPGGVVRPHIVGIRIYANNLNGKLPRSIGNLYYCKSICMASNNIEGAFLRVLLQACVVYKERGCPWHTPARRQPREGLFRPSARPPLRPSARAPVRPSARPPARPPAGEGACARAHVSGLPSAVPSGPTRRCDRRTPPDTATRAHTRARACTHPLIHPPTRSSTRPPTHRPTRCVLPPPLPSPPPFRRAAEGDTALQAARDTRHVREQRQRRAAAGDGPPEAAPPR